MLYSLKAHKILFSTQLQKFHPEKTVIGKTNQSLHMFLRFFAYFQESVSESNLETYRVRFVRIYFYIDDDTIMVEEHKERNSQMDQGVIVKRMLIPLPNQFHETYHFRDINVGQDVDLNGVMYHVFSCDEFTRVFMENQGVAVGPDEEIPEDLYSMKRKITDRPMRISYTNTDKTNLKNFLQFDGKVLRFWAIWDDRQHIFGEKRRFVVIYFLVDGRIEVRQILPPNSGRDTYATFLHKTHLKKPGTGEFYSDRDLELGKIIDVFERKFLLYDTDQFTMDFLDNKYGDHDWTPIAVEDDFDFFAKGISVYPH